MGISFLAECTVCKNALSIVAVQVDDDKKTMVLIERCQTCAANAYSKAVDEWRERDGMCDDV